MNIIDNPINHKIWKAHPLLWVLLINLIPIIGVLYADWSASSIIVLYWLESWVIGIFTVLKILTSTAYNNFLLRLGFAIFFCFHFGIFCTVQGAFIFIGLKGNYHNEIQGVKYAILWVAGNYLFQYLFDFILTGKYKEKDSISLFAVYGRIFIQQFVIIAGGFITIKINADENSGMLFILIFLKTLVDYGLYKYTARRDKQNYSRLAANEHHRVKV